MRVYVIMTNDFPEAVYSDKATAEAICKKQNSIKPEPGFRKVYWRVYEFELKEATNAPASN